MPVDVRARDHLLRGSRNGYPLVFWIISVALCRQIDFVIITRGGFRVTFIGITDLSHIIREGIVHLRINTHPVGFKRWFVIKRVLSSSDQ